MPDAAEVSEAPMAPVALIAPNASKMRVASEMSAASPDVGASAGTRVSEFAFRTPRAASKRIPRIVSASVDAPVASALFLPAASAALTVSLCETLTRLPAAGFAALLVAAPAVLFDVLLAVASPAAAAALAASPFFTNPERVSC